MANENIIILISLVISISVFFIARVIINQKLKDLHGHQKILGITVISIIFGELLFLGLSFGLFNFALEIVASIGVGMVVLGISFQNTLKNWTAGIGIFFNSEVNLGDTIQIKETKGKIIKIGLSKTIAATENGAKIFIPNQKFNEEVIIITRNLKTD
ncbi:MAG: mechanosensitive ion channel family protein [Nitrosopumilus sp.]|nr:mechanosensitive ion channel family protein [Nitrosopumilus sp.]